MEAVWKQKGKKISQLSILVCIIYTLIWKEDVNA